MSTLKEFSNSLIFPLGDKLPEQFSKFFIGNVTLNLLVATIGIFIIKAVKCY